MNTWVQVDKLEDKEAVNAETFNRPIDQLASRTEYLKKRLGTVYENGVQSALIVTDVYFITDSDDPVSVGDIVYMADGGFHKAQAKMDLYDDFKAADSAFTLGIVVEVANSKGNVLISGQLKLGELSGATKTGMLVSGETFRSGRYYLSASEAGKITANPEGPFIYIGAFHSEDTLDGSFSADAVAYFNPQFLDIGQGHVHRAYPMVARPAGTVIGNKVIGYLPSGAQESSSDSSSDELAGHYPSLLFSGTWTSISSVKYNFSVVGSEWGNISLWWYENGDESTVQHKEIPAPGVTIDLDNGLKVKVMFPDATSSSAYSGLSGDDLKWELTFPDDGKGWVDHSVTAEAKEVFAASTTGPSLHAHIEGSWSEANNGIHSLFPVYTKVFSPTYATGMVSIGDSVYEFVNAGDSPSVSTYTAVSKGATLNESLHNLANAVNQFESTTPIALVTSDNKLVICTGTSILPSAVIWGSNPEELYPTFSTSVPLIKTSDPASGIIPTVVIYDDNHNVLSLTKNQSTYSPISCGDLEFTIYAKDATASNNYSCKPDTFTYAEAYDPCPDAAYEYVMGLHQAIDHSYPPVPAQAAEISVNGIAMENAALFKSNPTFTVGHDTIYWMTNALERLPWPDLIVNHNDPVDPAFDKKMVLSFVKGFQCATGPVTSLNPAPGSAIKFYTYGTYDEAYTGDLMADVALDLSVSDVGVSGYNVAKQGQGGKLLAGPVVERVKAGNGIIITQPADCPDGQGTVTIGLDDGTLRGNFTEVALENAKQEKIGLFPYVSLLGWSSTNQIPSAFTLMMRVPSNLDSTKKYQMQFRTVMFGTASTEGSRYYAAAVQMEYNILPDYTSVDAAYKSLKTGLLVPDSARTINIQMGHLDGTTYKYVAYDPFVATTESDAVRPKTDDVCIPFSSLPIPSVSEFSSTTPLPTLRPGYLVALRISRTSMTATSTYNEYTSPLGFLTLEWTLEEAE